MRAHVIENGKIVNTIVVDSLDIIPNLVEATSGGIGDLWDGEKAVKPPKWGSVEEAKADVGRQIDALRIDKTFTDVNVTFPSGEKKDIQFRNEFDLSNLLSVAMAGLALIVSGKANDPLVYRTKDNATQVLKAVEMVGIGMTVMAEKQAIVSAAWAHKDAIKSLSTLEEIEAYDIITGWPK